jgi:hypothetical protein
LKPLCGFSFVQTIRGSFAQQIEPVKGAMRMEEVDKLFSINAHFALPSCSQDKRKVKRCVQNLNREFVDHP